jgi:hypothetical protein
LARLGKSYMHESACAGRCERGNAVRRDALGRAFGNRAAEPIGAFNMTLSTNKTLEEALYETPVL